ncbi:MAG TPA: hypothetical protein PLL20_15065 [Phycisphaerae bacterium]|nr:hypothetical protein [Phycisphaerae bacterium]HRR86137.1 hypothetical protein [Phycisphaerae bacterium]
MSATRTWIGVVTFVVLTTALALMHAGCGNDEPKPPDRRTNTDQITTGIDDGTQAGADKDDDPKHPRALPRTGDVAGWVKTRAVSTAPAGKLADLVKDPEVLTAVKAFDVRSLASCRYNQQITSAEVLFIETASPADAFGLVSVLVPEPAEWLAADRSVRAVHIGSAAMRLVAQQGKVCVLVDVAGRVDDEDIRRSSRRLMDHILFSLPAADPPMLMQVIPPSQQASTKLWLVRDLTILSKAAHPLIRQVATTISNQSLGLSGDATITIAAVPPIDDADPHLIWLAEYPTPDAAKAAYDRCKAASRPADSSQSLHLTVLEPKGKLLAGAWTEQASTAMPLLKNLQNALPG